MGRYAVYSGDVINRYPRCLTDSRAATLVDSTYLLPAEAEVDARLGARFSVPFSSNNMTVKDLVIDMTMLRMGTYKERDEELRAAVDARIKALLDGTMVMVTASGTVASYAASGVISTTMSYHPVFGVGSVTDMEPDEQRVEDEDNAR